MKKVLILFAVVLLAVWLLPPFVLICAAAVCIGYVVLRCNSYCKWLEKVGIGSLDRAPGSQRAHERAIEHGYAELFDQDTSTFLAMSEGVPLQSGYVMSTKFRDRMLSSINQKRILTEAEFQKCCRDAAPHFQKDYADALVNYFTDRENLLEVSYDGPYLSIGMVKDCEQILNREGAATEVEFAELCGQSVASWLDEQRDEVAEAVLSNMVSCGRAKKVTRTEDSTGTQGRFLYVSNIPSADCRMTKREISLD